jgi:hypothetical protein
MPPAAHAARAANRIPVLFDRELKPHWLDYALERFIESASHDEMNELLREYLSAEISSPTSLRKTVRQLDRTVGYLSPIPAAELHAAYDKMRHLPADRRLPVRLALLAAANPFVADCVKAIEKLDRLGTAGIAATQLYDRLASVYGDRGTVPRRVRYVLRTLAHFGYLENRERRWHRPTTGTVTTGPSYGLTLGDPFVPVD